MSFKRGLIGAVCLFAAAGAGFLFVGVQREMSLLPAEERTVIDGLRRDLLRVDSQLKRHALQSRYGMTQHYDELMRSSLEMQKLSRRWVYEVRRAGSMVGEAVETSSVAATIAAQRARVETFKASNARLRNSFRYLPRAGDELRRITAEGRSSSFLDLQGAADAVVRATFMLAAFRGQEDRNRLEVALRILETKREALSKEIPPRFRREAFVSQQGLALARSKVIDLHGQLCARVIPRVDALLADIREAPISMAVADLDSKYRSFVRTLDLRRETLQSGVYGLTALLAVLLAAAGIFLRRLYASLERKVTERTASLQALYQSNRVVLENVGEGLVTTTVDGSLSSQMSAAAKTWFGEHSPLDSAWSWLGRSDPKFAAYLELVLGELIEDIMPREVVMSQLPGRLVADGRTFDVTYTLMDDGPVEEGSRILMTFVDVTVSVVRAAEERRMSEVITLVKQLSRDRTGTLEFLDDASRLVEDLSPQAEATLAKRGVHTLKGNAAIFGLRGFAELCHVVEDRLDEEGGSLNEEEVSVLRGDWRRIREEISAFVGADGGNTLDVSPADLAQLRTSLESGATPAQVDALVSTWSLERLSVRWNRTQDILRSLAGRLGKPEPKISVQDGGIRLDAERWRAFWGSFVHVLRNTVDHGLESAAERSAAGKPEQGTVELSAERSEDGLIRLRVRDDGRGIDWKRVAEKARLKGLPAETQADLQLALFSDGVSTRDQVSATSGRGVGMAAVREATEALGGHIHVSSEIGQGTTVVFEIPEHSEKGTAASAA